MSIYGLPPSFNATPHTASPMLANTPVGAQSTDLQHSTIKPVAPVEETTTVVEPAREQQRTKQQLAQQQRNEWQMLERLAARDQKVRNHEQAHASVGGVYAGAPRYHYQRGPDGVNYAIGGEVSISTSPVRGDPQMTIEKAQTVKRAALAPAEPSVQDRMVAAEARQMEMQARIELMLMQREQQRAQQQSMHQHEAQVETTSHNTQDEAVSSATANTVQPHRHKHQAQQPLTVQQTPTNSLATQLTASSDLRDKPQPPGTIVNQFI